MDGEPRMLQCVFLVGFWLFLVSVLFILLKDPDG